LPALAAAGKLASFMAEHALTTAARALRAMEVLAGDLATERREAAALRRENASLRAEVERLKAGRLSEPQLEALRSREVPGGRGNRGGRSGP
jgi:cell division protein FtsB